MERNISVTSNIEMLAKYSLHFNNKIAIFEKSFNNGHMMFCASLLQGYCNSNS
jgi:hypothetical protein